MISKTISRICYEDPSLIENYELAIVDTKMWHCHHRVETIMHCGAKELIAKGCYKDRPAHDLIFLTKSEHRRLHNFGNKNMLGHKHSDKTRAKIGAANKGNTPFLGRKHTEAARAKMSEAHRGEKHYMYGKHHSEDTLEKLRAAMNRPETRAKISAANKGKTLSNEHRAKLSAASKGSHWFNNGVECRFCKESPGPGWKEGRGSPRKKKS